MENSYKKNNKNLFIFNIISFLCLFLLYFLRNIPYIRAILLSTLIILFFISYLMFGFRKDKGSSVKIKILLQYIICLLIYLIIVYTLGIRVSYIKNKYTLVSLENILYITLNIVFAELLRYNIITRNINNRKQPFITLIFFVLLETLVINNYCFINNILLITIVSIEKNILLNNNCKHGFKSNVVYSLVIELIPNLLTYPNMSSYMYVILLTILNIVLLILSLKLNRKQEKEIANNFKKGTLLVVEVILSILVAITIALVSGLFKYSLSSIASNSMYPAIKKGDAIILRKLTEKEKDELKVGDIIAFKEGNYIITHRIIEIGDGVYITKGDNNNIQDTNKRTRNDIVGKIVTRIPYVGYPSVFVSEILNE